MQINRWFESTIKQKQKALALMIDYVVNEKKVLTFNDHVGKLNRFMIPRNQPRMNQLLSEYLAEKRNDPEWVLHDLFREGSGQDEVKKSQ